ncbi:MAG: Hsp20/alpha crystallin family protein [Candidatus Nitrosopolaris sp.]
MWHCDIESYDWFRRFESRYFADDFFTDFEEEMQEEIEDAFTDIDDPKELIQDYQILNDVGVREFSSFVYEYSMTIEYNDKSHIRKIRNEGVGSGGSKREVHKYNRPHITRSEESLAEVNIYDKEVKAVLEMPGASKDHIKIRTYENSVEIFSDHPRRRSQVIKIPQVADIKTIRATYKNGILEMVFKKKEKPKLKNKLRQIKIE